MCVLRVIHLMLVTPVLPTAYVMAQSMECFTGSAEQLLFETFPFIAFMISCLSCMKRKRETPMPAVTDTTSYVKSHTYFIIIFSYNDG